MSQEWTVIVVYCDGRAASSKAAKKKTNRHEPQPLAIYNRRDGQWGPIHSGVFRGRPVIISDIGFRHLIGDNPQPQPSIALDEEARNRRRSVYRWECGSCPFDEIRKDVAIINAVFDLWAARDKQEISLAQINSEIEKITKKAAKKGVRVLR